MWHHTGAVGVLWWGGASREGKVLRQGLQSDSHNRSGARGSPVKAVPTGEECDTLTSELLRTSAVDKQTGAAGHILDHVLLNTEKRSM